MLIQDFKKRYTSIPFAVYGRNYKDKEMEGYFHLHREIEILLVLDGYADLFLVDRHLTIKKGDIIFLSPFTPHRYKIEKGSNFSHNCVCFDSSLICDKALSQSLEENSLKIPYVINDDYAFSVIENAYKAYLKKENGFELFITGSISLFFSELMKKSLIEKSETPDTNFHKTVIDYVEKNLSENITSTDIAKALHINHSYFCRLFRKNFNLCFQNYLALCRIEKAKSLLKNTDLSVSEIALKVGFNSISYFTKIFKKEVSITPNQYRKA